MGGILDRRTPAHLQWSLVARAPWFEGGPAGITMFFSAPKLLIVLAVIFLLFAVPIMSTIILLVRRNKDSKNDD